jgi:hypothetical protein
MKDLIIQQRDPHANEFFGIQRDQETDVRFIWPKMIYLYTPMYRALIQTLQGVLSPQQAADALAAAARR